MATKLETNITIKIDGKSIRMEGQYAGSRGDLLTLAGAICGGLGVTPDEIEDDPIGKFTFLFAMKCTERKGTETVIEFKPDGKEEVNDE